MQNKYCSCWHRNSWQIRWQNAFYLFWYFTESNQMKMMRDENEDAANASISLYFALFCSVVFVVDDDTECGNYPTRFSIERETIELAK